VAATFANLEGGRTIAVGTNSETIWAARAAAVLFILANDMSSVLRIWISSMVGGFGLKPASTKIIHPMPVQMNNAKKP
jgi:hypothetical protein